MPKNAKRDRRLLVALLLLAAAAASLLIQAWISMVYFKSGLAQNWTYYLELFPSYARPPLAPGVHCYDDCTSPYQPVVAGWIGVVSFFLGLSVLAFSWWKPRASDLR
jgi:hypothetical protein